MLFSKFNQEDIDIYQTKNVNYHFHKYGISIKDFYKEELNNVFNISTFGTDIKGQKFVNSIFHKDLPIHGVQYHPETSNFLTYKNDINEDYYWSRKLSFKTLQGIKDIIKNKGPKIEVELNDEILEKVYELSTIPLLVEDKYNTGKSTLKGYLFSFEDFPFKLK